MSIQHWLVSDRRYETRIFEVMLKNKSVDASQLQQKHCSTVETTIKYSSLDINLSLWGFKSGVVNDWIAFGRMRRQVRWAVVDIDSVPGIRIITPLDIF